MARQKKFWQKFFYSKLFFLILILIICVLGFNLFTQFSRSQEVENRVEKIKADIMTLEKENISFKETINYLKSDLFVEKEARIKLGLKKEGEVMVVVENSVLTPTQNEPREKKEIIAASKLISNPGLWWNYFFKQER